MPSSPSPLWPASLHHLALVSPEPDRLTEFLARTLQMRCKQSASGGWVELSGPGRLLVVGPGSSPGVLHLAFALADPERVAGLHDHFMSRGALTEAAESPYLQSGSFRIRAPDGVTLLFGAPTKPQPESQTAGLPGRLQHAVFRTPEPLSLLSFLIDKAGFVLSDRVEDDTRTLAAGFVRSNPEHHSFAAFRAACPAFDHFALEAHGWNDLRDWADHFAELRVPIWWGPGRHGPGNNLFIMIRDPDGNRIEISAEMEHMARDAPHRTWPLEERTLNLWGTAWMRT